MTPIFYVLRGDAEATGPILGLARRCKGKVVMVDRVRVEFGVDGPGVINPYRVVCDSSEWTMLRARTLEWACDWLERRNYRRDETR